MEKQYTKTEDGELKEIVNQAPLEIVYDRTTLENRRETILGQLADLTKYLNEVDFQLSKCDELGIKTQEEVLSADQETLLAKKEVV